MKNYVFFNDTATTEIYTLSLHDALPISRRTPPASRGRVSNRDCKSRFPGAGISRARGGIRDTRPCCAAYHGEDRKSTRLNSSHANISYAVFCLKKNILSPPSSPFHLLVT